MTEENRLALLRGAVESNGSQMKVAKMLGYSSATISQVLGGTYQGALDNFLTRVEEVFGTNKVPCPILGEILLGRCVKERRSPFSTANPLRVQLYRACMKCPFNTERINL
jgi:hypothetical protein